MARLLFEDAVRRFHYIVMRSSGYTGDLRDINNIERRFRSIYNKQIGYIPKPRIAQMSILDALLIEKLLETAPFAPQRRKPMRRFFTELLLWTDYIMNMSKRDPVMFTYMAEQYPYFRKNVKDGYVPLPYMLMRIWNFRYHEIVDFTKKIGFVEPLETESSLRGAYSVVLHTCKYCCINRHALAE